MGYIALAMDCATAFSGSVVCHGDLSRARASASVVLDNLAAGLAPDIVASYPR
jgi:hypothetical protein